MWSFNLWLYCLKNVLQKLESTSGEQQAESLDVGSEMWAVTSTLCLLDGHRHAKDFQSVHINQHAYEFYTYVSMYTNEIRMSCCSVTKQLRSREPTGMPRIEYYERPRLALHISSPP